MKILRTRRQLLKWRLSQRLSVGFVPTMGALHEGHLSLVRRAREENKRVIASIFVNPTQFGPREDLSLYPRQEKKDFALLKREGCDAVFAPLKAQEVYPRSDETSILARPSLSRILCGVFRPGHFDGVCTVVFKLFRWVEPHRAYFGLKDYQQVKVIEAMVEDFDLRVKIVPCPTLREPTGLAMSSRNTYLSSKDQRAAAELFRILSMSDSLKQARRLLTHYGFEVQYLESRSEDLLSKAPEKKGLWLVAAYFKGVRLIDHVKKIL
jgi:pantoate--beta-alanine ligase